MYLLMQNTILESIAGAWVEITDEDAFLETIKELHKDEEDPEYMFQDFKEFPDMFYSERSLDSELWQWLELDDEEKEIVVALMEEGYVNNIESALDLKDTSFLHESWDAICEFWVGGMKYPEDVKRYLDWDKVKRKLESDLRTIELSDGSVLVIYY